MLSDCNGDFAAKESLSSQCFDSFRFPLPNLEEDEMAPHKDDVSDKPNFIQESSSSCGCKANNCPAVLSFKQGAQGSETSATSIFFALLCSSPVGKHAKLYSSTEYSSTYMLVRVLRVTLGTVSIYHTNKVECHDSFNSLSVVKVHGVCSVNEHLT
jgi:hypothetical protein